MNTNFSLRWNANPKYVNVNTLAPIHTDKRDRIKELSCGAWKIIPFPGQANICSFAITENGWIGHSFIYNNYHCFVLLSFGFFSHFKFHWGNNQNVKFNSRDSHLSLESLHLLKVFQIFHFRTVIIIHYKLNFKFSQHSQNAWGNHYCKMFFSPSPWNLLSAMQSNKT